MPWSIRRHVWVDFYDGEQRLGEGWERVGGITVDGKNMGISVFCLFFEMFPQQRGQWRDRVDGKVRGQEYSPPPKAEGHHVGDHWGTELWTSVSCTRLLVLYPSVSLSLFSFQGGPQKSSSFLAGMWWRHMSSSVSISQENRDFQLKSWSSDLSSFVQRGAMVSFVWASVSSKGASLRFLLRCFNLWDWSSLK